MRTAAANLAESSAPTDVNIQTGLQPGPADARPLDWPHDCGAECVFLGRTRIETHPDHGRLVRLEYQAYGPMVERGLKELARAAVDRFGCRALRIVHATGAVLPGQASIVIQVACAHRAEAFEACRYLIDRLKHEMPIWKREVWEHGETFVAGCAVRAHTGEAASDG